MSDFIDINNINSSKEFISKNIIPGSNKNNLPNHLINMKWEDIKFLKKNGHTIGAHTKSHKKLSKIIDNKELNDEICINADIISKKLDHKIEHFAYSFGDVLSFSQKAYNVASNKFHYIHSGIRGNNINIKLTDIIFRDEIDSSYSNTLTESFLNGLIDFKYKKDIKTLREWSKNYQY